MRQDLTSDMGADIPEYPECNYCFSCVGMAKRKRNPARDDSAFELSHIHNTCICMYPKALLMHIRNSVSKH